MILLLLSVVLSVGQKVAPSAEEILALDAGKEQL
jgi:hypothetical protein